MKSNVQLGIGRALLLGAALVFQSVPSSGPADQFAVSGAHRPSNGGVRTATRFADFGAHTPSPDVRHVVNWIVKSGDNGNLEFVVVDKKFAKMYVFDVHARLRGSSPVLLGSAIGDDTVPGIGLRPIADVQPQERTTPAGRFLAERGHNARGEDVVWVDYDAAVSMHRVLRTNPEERRLERLASATVADNRVSWGCINVPVAFYEKTVRPTFAHRRAWVYVLPDVKPLQQVFASYDKGALAQWR